MNFELFKTAQFKDGEGVKRFIVGKDGCAAIALFENGVIGVALVSKDEELSPIWTLYGKVSDIFLDAEPYDVEELHGDYITRDL